MRTGVFEGRDPVREYAAFVLAAPAFLAVDEGAPAHAFADLPDGAATAPALATHLSTLFPESRPRGYLELRSLDAVNTEERRRALALVAGLFGDDRAAARAAELLDEPDPDLLRAAGREGMTHPKLSALAPDLLDLAAAGCARLGESVVSGALVGESFSFG
jgi:glutamate--cysteine ligase